MLRPFSTLLFAGAAGLIGACSGGELELRGASSAGAGAGGVGAAGMTGAGAPGAAGAAATSGSSGVGGASAGSGGDAGAAGASDAPAFIAFSESFKDFTSWPSFYLGEVTPTTNEMVGPRTVYINALPPAGSHEFPVGTIIVKAIQIGDPSMWQIFAMAKRGADFNALGAVGWEWFELSLKFDALNVLWRGNAPPNGMGYGGGVSGGVCNTCHGAAKANDYVQGDFLKLP